jgi:hypothetical protein
VALENFKAGAILKTLDGGKTWKRHPINDPQHNANLEGVGFVDAQHGWVGGWGDSDFLRLSSSETLDGGVTWRDANEIGHAINRFRFFGRPVTLGYASGQTVYKYSSERLPQPPAGLAPIGPQFFDSLEPVDASGAITIGVSVPPGAQRLTVRIWDRFGDLVVVLVDEPNPASGRREITWDRTDEAGQRRPTGHFIWRVTVDDTSESRLTLIR